MPTSLTQEQLNFQRLSGLAFGSIFAAFVALGWVGIFTSLEGGTSKVVSLVLLLLAGFLTLARSIYLLRKYRLPKGIKLPYFEKWSFWLKFYGVIAIEVLAIYGLTRLLDAHHLENGLFPLIVFIVGAHFYPLAALNGNKIWYATATVLCLGVMVLVVVAAPGSSTDLLGAKSSVWALGSSGLMILTMLATSIQSGRLYERSNSL